MTTDPPTGRIQYPDGSQGGYAATAPDHNDPDRRATAAEMEAARAWAADFDGGAEEYDLALAVLVHARKRLDEQTMANVQSTAWVMPKIEHDENRPVGPIVRPNGWIARAQGHSDVAHTRFYAAQLLAAADEAERRIGATTTG